MKNDNKRFALTGKAFKAQEHLLLALAEIKMHGKDNYICIAISETPFLRPNGLITIAFTADEQQLYVLPAIALVANNIVEQATQVYEFKESTCECLLSDPGIMQQVMNLHRTTNG